MTPATLYKVPERTGSKSSAGRIYCGPAALMAMTGKPYKTIRAVLNQMVDKPDNAPVMSVTTGRIKRAIINLGLMYRPIGWVNPHGYRSQRPTLGQWLAMTKEQRDPAKYYLIHLTGHYVTISGQRLIDNWTREPVSILRAPHMRRRVVQVWEVWQR